MQLARATYVAAKGAGPGILPWDAPPGKPDQGLPFVHKAAWGVVTTGLLAWLQDPEEEDEEEALRHAWEVYVLEIGAAAFAIPWRHASQDHKEAWAAVLAALRERTTHEGEPRS